MSPRPAPPLSPTPSRVTSCLLLSNVDPQDSRQLAKLVKSVRVSRPSLRASSLTSCMHTWQRRSGVRWSSFWSQRLGRPFAGLACTHGAICGPADTGEALSERSSSNSRASTRPWRGGDRRVRSKQRERPTAAPVPSPLRTARRLLCSPLPVPSPVPCARPSASRAFAPLA